MSRSSGPRKPPSHSEEAYGNGVVRWVPDCVAARVVAQQQLSGEWCLLPLAEIAWELSLRNMGRCAKALNEEMRERYCAAMRQGDYFPGVVVYRTPDGKYIILGGFHRAHAARLVKGETHVYAYVITQQAPPMTLQVLPALLNDVNGVGHTREERMYLALIAIEEGHSKATVARLFRFSREAINKALRVEKVVATCRSLGVGVGAGAISTEALDRLAKLSNQPRVMAEAARAVLATGKTVPETAAFVAEVDAAGDEAAKLEKCAKEACRNRIRPDSPGRPVAPLTTFQRFNRSLKSVDTILDNVSKVDDLDPSLDRETREKFCELAEKVAGRLAQIVAGSRKGR